MTALFARLAEPSDHDRDSEDDLALRGAYDQEPELLPCGCPFRTIDHDELELDLCARCMPVTCEAPLCTLGGTFDVTTEGQRYRLCRRHADRYAAHGFDVLGIDRRRVAS